MCTCSNHSSINIKMYTHLLMEIESLLGSVRPRGFKWKESGSTNISKVAFNLLGTRSNSMVSTLMLA